MNEPSLSLVGLRGARGVPDDPRAAIEWVASLGYRAIQLDATMPGLRPRDLDRSARRGVSALLKSLELSLSGLDLWIPIDHFSDPSMQTRAIDASEAAVSLAADLRAQGQGAVVSLELPAKVEEAAARIAEVASRHGVLIADHGLDGPRPACSHAPLGIGLDPSPIIEKDLDPAASAAKAGAQLASAHLRDSDGRKPVPLGRGRLDLLAYGAALSVAGYQRPVVIDVRDLQDPADAATRSRTLWPPT